MQPPHCWRGLDARSTGMIDDRIENFARCGVSSVDEWANQFRLDRTDADRARTGAPLGRSGDLEAPAEAGIVSTILDFFAKRISGGVLRGPLTRMLVGKSAARVDLTELDTSRVPAAEILEHLLRAGPDGQYRSSSILRERWVGTEAPFAAFPCIAVQARYRHRGPLYGLPVSIDARRQAEHKAPHRSRAPVAGARHSGSRQSRTRHAGIRTREKHRRRSRIIVVNPALEGIVGIQEAKRWQEAAKELLARATFSALDVMDAFGHLATAVGNTLSPLPGKDVKVGAQERQILPSAVLFHLAFMGQAVMKDLEFLRGLPPSATALEAALRLSDHKPESEGPTSAREIERYFTADSDPSQEAAVMEARQAPGLVVEGPPGTGKSQTIVNMVADAIGMGKSLLVICQKQAALEVVRKRLERNDWEIVS